MMSASLGFRRQEVSLLSLWEQQSIMSVLAIERWRSAESSLWTGTVWEKISR